MSCRVAIIGSGISGLTAGWLLGKKHQVTIFERGDRLGLGHHGCEIDVDGRKTWIDIPPRITNAIHYPSLFGLLEELGLQTFSVKQQASFSELSGKTYLSFRTVTLGKLAPTFPKLGFSTALWLTRYSSDLVRFFSMLWWTDLERVPAVTLKAFLHQNRFDRELIHRFLYPMWALICTCDVESLERFPAKDMMKIFYSFTSVTATKRIRGGVRAFEKAIIGHVDQVRLNHAVESIVDHGDQISVCHSSGEESFDHVVLGTQPHRASLLLKSSFSEERECLESVPATDAKMVIHTDSNLMPKRQCDWTAINLFWDKKQEQATATMWMNQLESKSLGRQNIFQSWQPLLPIQSEKILGEVTLQRSLVNSISERRMKKLRRMMTSEKKRRLWFVGSYVVEGVPLLENGVRAARLVAELIEKQHKR